MAWGRLDTIVIDHTKVPNTDQTDFPVGIIKTDNNFKSTGNGGYMQNASAFDLRIYSDAALTTALKYERVIHNLTTGEIEYWVKVPTLTTATDVTLYMAFGDASITTDQSDPTNVWDTNFKSVWHLKDGSTLSGAESTSNGLTLTLVSTPTAGAGQVDGCAVLGASATMTRASSTLNLTTFTYEGWAKDVGASGATIQLFERGDGGNNVNSYLWWQSGFNRWVFGFNNGSGYIDKFYSASAPDTNWHHYAFVMNDAADLMKLFIDGVEVSSQAETSTPTTAGTQTFYIGSNRFGVSHWNCNVDEFRISGSARSADWIKTGYNNQSSPSTFMSHTFSTPSTGIPGKIVSVSQAVKRASYY
jgi:biopolymer transport protein ExbB